MQKLDVSTVKKCDTMGEIPPRLMPGMLHALDLWLRWGNGGSCEKSDSLPASIDKGPVGPGLQSADTRAGMPLLSSNLGAIGFRDMGDDPIKMVAG